MKIGETLRGIDKKLYVNNKQVCDSDYRGNIKVALHNDTDKPQTVSAGERIAQFIVMPYVTCNFIEVDELNDTSRGEGGFGSTGKF